MTDTPPGIDTSKQHSARMYDYYLGGKNHFAADREAAEKALAAVPTARTGARENRAFLGRAVRYLAAEAGIRQFLDIGTGLPTSNPVHEVAQSVAPSARIVYVDNDLLVLAHARALLTSSPQGRTAYIQADLREPEAILADPVTREVLDFSQPVALMLVSRGDRRDPAWRPAAGQLSCRLARHGGTSASRGRRRGALLPRGRGPGTAARFRRVRQARVHRP
jgi:hypothetical protein